MQVSSRVGFETLWHAYKRYHIWYSSDLFCAVPNLGDILALCIVHETIYQRQGTLPCDWEGEHMRRNKEQKGCTPTRFLCCVQLWTRWSEIYGRSHWLLYQMSDQGNPVPSTILLFCAEASNCEVVQSLRLACNGFMAEFLLLMSVEGQVQSNSSRLVKKWFQQHVSVENSGRDWSARLEDSSKKLEKRVCLTCMRLSIRKSALPLLLLSCSGARIPKIHLTLGSTTPSIKKIRLSDIGAGGESEVEVLDKDQKNATSENRSGVVVFWSAPYRWTHTLSRKRRDWNVGQWWIVTGLSLMY